MHMVLVHAQDSCACTTLSCMHFFLGPGLGPWPLQCMHKSVVHAQECCACTRILCMHKNLGPKHKPLLLGIVRPPAVLFSGKKASGKTRMRNYEKIIVFMCFIIKPKNALM